MKSVAPLLLFLLVSHLSAAGESANNPSVDDMIDKAVDAERRNDYAAARELYIKATESFPTYAQAWAAYGEHLRFFVYDDAAAAAAFHKAVEASNGDKHAFAFAWRGLGELEAKKGREVEAVRLMEKSLEIMPLSDTHRSLCHLYVMRKDWKKAAEHARLAAEIEPDDPIALLLYAAQLHRAGETEKGEAQFKKALEIAGCDEHGKSTGHVHCCVLYNAAGYQAVCGDQKRALELLEAFFKTPNHRHLTRKQIEEDSDFIDLRENATFVKLLDEYAPVR